MEKYILVAPAWMCTKRPSMCVFALARVARCEICRGMFGTFTQIWSG